MSVIVTSSRKYADREGAAWLRLSVSAADLPRLGGSTKALHFALEQAALQAAAVALHCATQAPDNPQFCEHEKFTESQFVTHSLGT
ncbi:hypothetical protein BSZ19_20125 [Bradyrhizobium japonicum]|uniref:Uncharacterized protein n=1 Tax=Bradyrhizobium japonicum TaxID=375 RepID=A0A1Y2JMU2_BRAJP|nr:hypothetical protein BSZ19_20125 [Bradyrhizobium japonicum]